MAPQKWTLDDLRQDLERRLAFAEDSRTPGGLEPSGVYWNGFHSGIQAALGALKSLEDKMKNTKGGRRHGR